MLSISIIMLVLSVCLSTRISEPHVQTSRNFLRVLTVAVALSCYYDSAIHYVLSVLFGDIMGQNQAQHCFIEFSTSQRPHRPQVRWQRYVWFRWWHRGRSLMSVIVLFVSDSWASCFLCSVVCVNVGQMFSTWICMYHEMSLNPVVERFSSPDLFYFKVLLHWSLFCLC